MWNYLKCFLMFIIEAYVVLASSSYDDHDRLYKDVIKTLGGDYPGRPITNQSEALTVYVDFHLNSVYDLDWTQETVHLCMWINFTWTDQIRRWNPADYSYISHLKPKPVDIWRPRFLITNSIGESDPFQDDAFQTQIYHDGTTNWWPATMLHAYCSLDLTYFPFDRHECEIEFVSFDFETEIHIIATETKLLKQQFTTNGEWDFEDTITSPQYYNKTGAVATFTSKLIFKRRPLFFVMNSLLPIVILSALPSLVFVLPETSGERGSFATTILLAVTMSMGTVTGDLPSKTNPFPIIIDYLISLMCLSTLCVIVAIVQLRVLSMQEKTKDDFDIKKKARFEHETKSNQVVPYATVNNSNDIKKAIGSDQVSGQLAWQQTTNENQGGDADNIVHSAFSYIRNANVILFTSYLSIWVIVNAYFLDSLVNQ